MTPCGRGAIPALLLSLAVSGTALADGLVPPKPYNYLHPPPALARTNHRPSSGAQTVPLRSGSTANQFTVFTGDGQAGVGAPAGAYAVPEPATSLRVRIRPVNLPAPLPSGLTADGNAYAFDAVGSPGAHAARVTQPLALVLRWPHQPDAMYLYRHGHWSQVCTSRTWLIASALVICHPTVLGTFVLVRKVKR